MEQVTSELGGRAMVPQLDSRELYELGNESAVLELAAQSVAK